MRECILVNVFEKTLPVVIINTQSVLRSNLLIGYINMLNLKSSLQHAIFHMQIFSIF